MVLSRLRVTIALRLDVRQPSSIVALALELWQLGEYGREPFAILLAPLGVQARFLQVSGWAGETCPRGLDPA